MFAGDSPGLINPFRYDQDMSLYYGGQMMNLIRRLRNLPRNSTTIPVRIQLCQEALKQVRKEDKATLWAQLHSEMGLCLVQSPTGDHADNLEQAI